MPKQFQRTIESFECLHCGSLISGDGYTNHCPQCLWSKHVDINPGDRAEACCGAMEPISVEIKKGKPVLIHRCVRCGKLKRNKTTDSDSFDELLKIAGNRSS